MYFIKHLDAGNRVVGYLKDGAGPGPGSRQGCQGPAYPGDGAGLRTGGV